MQCASGAGGNGLIDRMPVGADDQHFARLDVAHVGGADQIHRARLRADDARRRRAGRARAAGSRADRGPRSAGPSSAARARRRPAPATTASTIASSTRRAPSTARRGAGRLRCRCSTGRSTPAARARRAARRALTRLPLWQMRDLAVRAVDQDRLRIRAACSRRPSSSARGRSPAVPAGCASVSPSNDVGDIAHRARDAHLLRRRTRRCRRSPGRDAAARRARGRSCWPLRDDRRCRRRRIRL